MRIADCVCVCVFLMDDTFHVFGNKMFASQLASHSTLALKEAEKTSKKSTE